MNTPKLRFKEFSGEWSLMTGDKIFETISDKKHNSDLPILAITQEQGAIPREFINYKISVTEKSVDSYKVVQKGDFIISLRSFQGGIEYSEYQGICSPAYIILRNKIKIDDAFYKTYFKTDKYILKLNAKLEGIRDGKMISYKYFSEIKLPYPTLPEQQKIASFFTAVDQKLTALKKKKELLEQYKKGVMQQIFSQKLRFKDENGNPFPEWEEKKLGEILDIQGGYAFKSSSFNKGNTKVLRIGDILPNIDIEEFTGIYSDEIPNEKYIVKKNDYLMALSGATYGKIGKIKTEGIAYINQRVATFRTSECSEFFFQMLQTENFRNYITSIPSASAQPNISNSDISNFVFKIPLIQEQQKIADFLSAIDNKINAVVLQIEKTEQWKKGLLQKMFV